MSDIELVIFDCDGVLVDSEIISAKMLKTTLVNLNVDISIAYILANFVGRSYPTVLKEIEAEFNVRLPDNFGDVYRESLISEFEKSLTAIPFVRETIEALEIPYCVATSSSPQRVARSFAATGLTDLFAEHVFTASQVQHGKPAPDLFLFAAKNMGMNPEKCLVIEDSIAGIKAAQSAGMNVMRFVGGTHLVGAANLTDVKQFASFQDFFSIFPNLKKH